MARHQLILLFKITVSLLFVTCLTLFVDWPELVRTCASVRLLPYAASTLAGLAGLVVLAGKHRVLFLETPLELPLASLARINLVTRFYALFLPSVIGPEAVRWYKIAGGRRHQGLYWGSMIFERASFVILLSLSAVIFLLQSGRAGELAGLREGLLLPGWTLLVIGLATLFVVLSPPLRGALFRLIPWQTSPGEGERGFGLRDESLGLPLQVMALSALWQALFILRIVLLVRAIEVPIGALDAAWIGSVVLLLQTIPLSFSGIGVREGAYAYLFVQLGLPSAAGATTGLLFFSQMLLFSLAGGVLEATGAVPRGDDRRGEGESTS